MKTQAAVLSLLFISSLAFAETATYTVEGMHCGGCKKMISAKVCDDPALKDKVESCKVSMLDEKKQTGQIVIVTKKDSKVDLTAVKATVHAGVKAAGEDYKITKEETKDATKEETK